MLKFDLASSLEQMDAVFVTVESNGESNKPSGKSLLFAYFKSEPEPPIIGTRSSSCEVLLLCVCSVDDHRAHNPKVVSSNLPPATIS